MDLKNYQGALLDAFEGFLARAKELKSPAAAFAESTLQHFGHSLPYHPLPGAPDTPYVCLRVPTGGGKTRLAGQAIARANTAYLPTDYSLTLWLVPSETIREQTLQALKTPGSLLQRDMQDLFGSVNVLNIGEALAVQPSVLATANTIIVATMQSFKQGTPDGLRVYRQNGALMPHFVGVSETQRGEHSLVDLIRLRCPFVVVDEAHNQGTPLAIDTLVRLNPACVLELTATPDRANQPSNVLRSVSAATLQSEDMLKLPLELAIHPEWRISLREAISRLRTLEQEATVEAVQTGEFIRPVMLIQAERSDANAETFTPQRVKAALIADFQIPAEAIAIATGAVDELGNKPQSAPDFPQFIITVDKLREGWDCPSAYVLFSFRNSTSATAVEQLLGRVLRMPSVRRKKQEALNRAYAYVVSSSLAATAQQLKDGLVASGFERMEARDLICAASKDEAAAAGDLFSSSAEVVIPLPEHGAELAVPDADAMAALPKALRERIEVSPEAGTLTIKGVLSAEQVKQVSASFKQPEVAKQFREQVDAAQAQQAVAQKPAKTPAEKGEKGVVPLLSFKQGSFFEVFDETPLLQADWEISSFDEKLTENDFAHDVEAMQRARLTLTQQEKVHMDTYDRLDVQLSLLAQEGGWNAVDLVGWLDRNIDFPYSEVGQKVAWLNAAVTYLMEGRGLTLDELAYRKFRLRGALERKLAAGLILAKQQVFDGLFCDETAFAVSGEHAVVFEQGRYAYDYAYTGFIALKRHFFPVIGNLKSGGEEYECAEFIANQLANVKWWVRNIEKKPGAFWLQTAHGRFYPDFVVRLESGVTLVVEYKGGHLMTDAKEKERIGKLWAARSGGKCRFVMVTGKAFGQISDAAK